MKSDLEKENERLKLLLRKKELMEQKLAAQEEERKSKPWLHLHPFYKWQRDFINSRSKKLCLTASNQCGKSSAMIIKAIEWYTNRELWPELFSESYKLFGRPRSMWYLYPSSKIVTSEFEEKWLPLLPPQDHPELGWRVIKRGRDVDTLEFLKLETTIRFKTYMQNVHTLQAGSCEVVAGDEEMPVDVIPELQMRTSATNGYMWFAFTATRGQNFWKQVVEDRTQWKDAEVMQISLYDCREYEDGSPSPWTQERIQRAIDSCVSEAQVQRRIMGKFVKDEGLKFQSFQRGINVAPYKPLKGGKWGIYVGIDYGSGGGKRHANNRTAHPSSIAFIAVDETFTQAKLVRCWRGDDERTTAEDVVNKYVEMARDFNQNDIVSVAYDYSAADIGIIANRRGLPSFKPAVKKRDEGVARINSLFKAEAMQLLTYGEKAVEDGVNPDHLQTEKLVEELESLGADEKKQQAQDDLIDGFRYASMEVAFDWNGIGAAKHLRGRKKEAKPLTVDEERLERMGGKGFVREDLVTQEIDFWNDLME